MATDKALGKSMAKAAAIGAVDRDPRAVCRTDLRRGRGCGLCLFQGEEATCITASPACERQLLPPDFPQEVPCRPEPRIQKTGSSPGFSGDMDAAFDLVPAAPAARARVFARRTLLVQGAQPIEG